MSGSTRLSPCASKTRSHPRSPTLVAGNPATWPQILSNRRIFRNFPPIEEILRISQKTERMNSFASFSFTELTDLHRRKSKVARTGVARHHGGDAEELCTRTPIVARHRFKAPPYNLMQMAATRPRWSEFERLTCPAALQDGMRSRCPIRHEQCAVL